MNVQIQSVKFDASTKLIEFIEKKLAKLDRVAEEATGVDVVLKLEKDDEKGNKIVVITLRMPGGDIRVEEQAHTFEEAVDNAKDVLKRQIEKRKDKYTITKKGGSFLFGPLFFATPAKKKEIA